MTAKHESLYDYTVALLRLEFRMVSTLFVNDGMVGILSKNYTSTQSFIKILSHSLDSTLGTFYQILIGWFKLQNYDLQKTKFCLSSLVL